VQGLDRFLGGLLGGEASPFVMPRLTRMLGLLQVTEGLIEPVTSSIRHPPSGYASLRERVHFVGDVSSARGREAVGLQGAPVRYGQRVERQVELVG
jgi:hypothetical protein